MLKRKQTSIIVASLLAFFCLSYFVAGQVQTAINKNIFGDTDQDGLSDAEEASYGTNINNADTDGDGYSDGVEVKGGYDPLKPAPGDRISTSLAIGDSRSQEGATLTENLSEVIEQFITAKEAGKETVSINEINDLVSGNLGDKIGGPISFDTLPKIARADINVKKQNYDDLSEEDRKAALKKDADKYLSDILYLLFTNSPKVIASTEDFDNFKKEFFTKLSALSSEKPDYAYFRNFATKLEVAVKQAEETEVPETLVDTHIKLLQLTSGYLALRDPSLPNIEDPTTRVIIMSRVRMLIELTEEFFRDADASLNP